MMTGYLHLLEDEPAVVIILLGNNKNRKQKLNLKNKRDVAQLKRSGMLDETGSMRFITDDIPILKR